MKAYLATVKDGDGNKKTIRVEAANRDEAMQKIPLRLQLVTIMEVPSK